MLNDFISFDVIRVVVKLDRGYSLYLAMDEVEGGDNIGVVHWCQMS